MTKFILRCYSIESPACHSALTLPFAQVRVEEGLQLHCSWIQQEHEERNGGLEDRYSALADTLVAQGHVKVVGGKL